MLSTISQISGAVVNIVLDYIFIFPCNMGVARAAYYEVISNQTWGSKENYDLCLNCEMGAYAIVKIICDYVKNKNNSLKR